MFGVPGVDMTGSAAITLPVCGTAAISAAAFVVGIPAAAASTALAVACVRAVNAATARPTAAGTAHSRRVGTAAPAEVQGR